MRNVGDRFTTFLSHPFRIVHVLWAVLILLGCVALISTGGGHPPPMAFVPALLLAGLLGHLLLWLIQWLLRKGRTRVTAGAAVAPRWPPELVFMALLLGPVAIMAIAITIGEVAIIHRHPVQWLIYLGVAVLHSAAFVLLLLRVGYVRYVIAAICFGWAFALVLQIGEARPGELPLGLTLIAGLIAIAIYVIRARRVRSALR